LYKRFRLILLTKGDFTVQESRIEGSGLKDFFCSIRILPHKSVEDFRRAILDNELDAGASWSIGNSLKSDINPALAVGLSAIWIPHDTWDAEVDAEVRSARLFKLDSLRECPKVLIP
jgi:putative hydrolase of the HAD superfamily